MRFMDPDEGCMRFSGEDLRALDPDEHRRDVALVPQDGHVPLQLAPGGVGGG